MHELSIAEALIEQVEAELARSGRCGPITRINLAIGRMSGVHSGALQFGLELLAPGTIIERASIVIRQPPAISRCRACGEEVDIDDMVGNCPGCQSPEITIERGREMLLESIELED